MKKVGLVTCYFKHNYGSMLQAYATQKFLDNNDILNETILIEDNKDFKNGKRKYYSKQLTNFKFIKNKFGMIKLKIDKKINKELGKNIAIRDKKYNEFKNEYNFSMNCTDYKGLSKLAEDKYTDVIVGSDQLWLPVNVIANYYTLNWVPDSVNKISYATSFGFSTIAEKYNALYTSFLKRINHLSVREDSGVKIVEKLGLNAKLVADPTMLLTKEQWDEFSGEKRIVDEDYILCYFLGNNIQHRKFAEKLKAETGLKIVSLNHADEYVKYSDKFCDIALYDIGPKEWVNLIKNSKYVLTDSFHGTVFSILFNKVFFDFRRHNNKSKVSTNSRIDSLLEVAGISNNRILTGLEDIQDVLKYNIDYALVNKNIETFRKDSQEWLLNSITWKKKNNNYVDVETKDDCCGCTACANICPKNAIEMVRDDEGFLYPKVDEEKCINCGLCRNICPVLNKSVKKIEQDGYVLNNKNSEVRANSTSGGAFTPIAEYVLNNNGVVFGAAFDSEFKVIHKYIENKADLNQLRGSKYVQSYLGNSFKDVKSFLDNNRMVCFSGTPCQIEGLKAFLKKDYDNLITVDVMCHAAPSPLVLKKYLSYIKDEKLAGENIKSVSFRDKSKYGFKYSTMTIKSDKKEYSNGVETDPYLRAFFGDLSDRPSCYHCSFKKQYHVSDFTIWDCFIVEKFAKELDDDKGTSRMLVNTVKGKEIFEIIKNEITYKKIEVSDLTHKVREMSYSVKYPSKRIQFFEDISKCSEKEFFNKYFPNSTKVKVEKNIRVFLAKTGLYKKIKNVAKGILRK